MKNKLILYMIAFLLFSNLLLHLGSLKKNSSNLEKIEKLNKKTETFQLSLKSLEDHIAETNQNLKSLEEKTFEKASAQKKLEELQNKIAENQTKLKSIVLEFHSLKETTKTTQEDQQDLSKKIESVSQRTKNILDPKKTLSLTEAHQIINYLVQISDATNVTQEEQLKPLLESLKVLELQIKSRMSE